MAELTPMMKQYLEIKEQNKDCILFFRLGDFYEMFFDDAKLVARELDLVLTGKDCGLEERAPMCGIPYHAVEGYLSKLIAKGYRVAICEQVEDPKTAKGLVKRDVIRIVSPGTVIEGRCLSEDRNNYICSLCFEADGCGIVFADISPRTQRIASATLLLPQPFGPTIQVTPLSNLISCLSAKDLKPISSTFLKSTCYSLNFLYFGGLGFLETALLSSVFKPFSAACFSASFLLLPSPTDISFQSSVNATTNVGE